MKILTSKVLGPLKTRVVNSDLEILDYEYFVFPISVNQIALFATARELIAGFGELEKDIIENGMRNPIIIAQNNSEVHKHGAEGMFPDSVADYDPTKPYICLFGNQRLTIANKNGFAEIASVIVKSPIEAIALHQILL